MNNLNTIANKVTKIDKHINTLYERYKDHKNWLHIYTINITPKGNNKTHEDTLEILLDRAKKCKSIKSIYLIRENQITNHFHGIVITSQQTKLYKLNSIKNYHIQLSPYNNINDEWIKYIMKHNPQNMDIYTKKLQTITEMAL